MQQISITANQAGQRLDKFLQKYFPQAGSGFLFKMLRKKNITLNGKKAQGNEILSEGDTVESFFSDETFRLFSGKENLKNHNIGLDEYQKAYQTLTLIQIVYEDEHVIILNKPTGVDDDDVRLGFVGRDRIAAVCQFFQHDLGVH